MIYTFTFQIHIYISAITLLAGFTNVILAARGWTRQREYSGADGWSYLIFTISLYLQLVLGLMIYFTLRTNLGGPLWEVPDTENDASLRFWAIEHIALMIFALFLTQLGMIFVKRSSSDIRRFRATVFYNGISLLLILFSLSIALFFR
jgi:hypothetical protein